MSASYYLDTRPDLLEAVPGSGPLPAKLAYVVGVPSLTRKDSNAVVGPATLALLDKMIPGSARSEVYITSLLKEPGNAKKKLPKREVQAAYPLLMEELKASGAQRIMVVGSDLGRVMCPGFKEMAADHGALFRNPSLGDSTLVVPTYSFSTTVYQPENREIITRDFERWLTLPVPDPPPSTRVTDVRNEVPWTKDHWVFDIETTGLDSRGDKIISVGFKSWGDPMVYICREPSKDQLLDLYAMFRKYTHTMIGHNIQFDLEWMMELTGRFWDLKIQDTMLMAHNLGFNSLKLKHLTTMLTDRPGSHVFGGWEDDGYLAEDVLSTQQVAIALGDAQKAYIHKLVNRAIPVAAELKWRGVPIDYNLLLENKRLQEEKVQAVTQRLNDHLPASLRGVVNWNSSEQVVKALRKAGVKLTEKTDAGAYTVKESVLLLLKDKHPVVADLLSYREEVKLMEFLTTYATKLGAEVALGLKPRLHPRLKIHGTATGRTSMEDPNLQQVTRTGPLKTMFISGFEGGYIGLVDLSQAELRAACLLSGDELFLEALLSDDVHKTIASWVYEIDRDLVTPFQRKKSKGITFGLLYGGGPKGLAARIGVAVQEVQKVVDIFFGKFKKLNTFIAQVKSLALREERIVDLFGRVRDLSALIAKEGPNSAKRKAINTPIQGLASHMSLSIMTFCFEEFRRRKMKSRVLFGVHDSTVIDVHPEEQDLVAEVVQLAFESLQETPLKNLPLWGKLPIVGELIFGKSWAAVESTNEHYDPLRLIPVSSHPEADLTGGRGHATI